MSVMSTIDLSYHQHDVSVHMSVMSTVCQSCHNDNKSVCIVEKLQFSLFSISCSQVILSSSYCTWYLFLKIACLHVSFTAYENFYKLSKKHCLLVLTFHFPIFRMSECRNPTIKHIFTYTLVSPFINTYVADLFLVIFFT